MMAHQSKKRAKRRGPPPRLPQRQGSDNSLKRRSQQEFQLISPLSDLSNPSCIKNLPTPFDPNNKEARTFVLENVPHPDRISKNRTHVLPNNAAVAAAAVNKNKKPAAGLDNKKKIKNKIATCLSGSAHRLDLMRMHTTKAVKQTYTKTVKQGVAKAKGIPSKKESLNESQDEGTLGMAALQPGESLGWTGSGTKESINNNTTGILNGTKDSYFERLWREQRADGSYIQNNHSIIQDGTPTVALDKAFEDALGLHRADDYFNRLADAPTVSPRLDQVESLASVMQEDTTCVSYLISEASNISPALSKTGTVVGEATVSKKYVPVERSGLIKNDGNDQASISSSPNLQEETNDSIFRVSSEARAKVLVKKQRNSSGSSNLIYSPETSQGESIASASLYTDDSPANLKDHDNAIAQQEPVEMVSSGVVPSGSEDNQVESRESVSSDGDSPIPLMGELVSLNSNKYSSDKSESPKSESSKSVGSDEESTKIRRDHVRIASLASFSSLPVDQDTSAIPFEEAGVSAIAEESVSKVEFCRQDSEPEESLQEQVNGSRLIACSDSDSASNEIVETDSDGEDRVEEASIDDCDDDGSNVIVGISTLPESNVNTSMASKSTLSHHEGEGDAYSASDEESKVVANESVDSESTFVQQDNDEGTVYSASDNESEEIIVAISKLPDESVASASIDMPSARLHFSDMSVDSPSSLPPPPANSSSEYQKDQVEWKVDQVDDTNDIEQQQDAEDSEEEEEEDSVAIKTAVATGRVFAPRGPGELLISVDLETLVNNDISTESSAIEEMSEASESMEQSKAESVVGTLEQQSKAINLIKNPDALLLQEQAMFAKSVDIKRVVQEAPVTVETVAEESIHGSDSDTNSKNTKDDESEPAETVTEVGSHKKQVVHGELKSKEVDVQSKTMELVTTKVTDNANGYAGDIMTLCSSPTALEPIDSKVEAALPDRVTAAQQPTSPTTDKSSQLESMSKPRTSPTLDYRKNATMTDKSKTSKASRLVVNYLAVDSPSGDSVATSVGGSPVPLLSEQALSNAAFLFSPSYADGKQRVLTRQAKPPREMSLSSISISTAESRSRLSTFSARSRPAFSIPVSTAPLNMSSIRPSQSSRSYEGSSFAEGESRQSQEEDQQITIGDSRAAAREGNDKRVHFSMDGDECHIIREANTSRIALGTPISVVSPPPIDRKISDLTAETTIPYATSTSESDPSPQASVDGLSHRQRVAKILRDIEEEDDETVEDDDSDLGHEEGGEGVSDSSPETAIHWTYREENGVLGAATPLRSNAHQGNYLAPTNSPRLRFKTAKNMFNKPAEKKSIQTSPSTKYTKPVGSSGSVSSRVSALNDRLRSNQQPNCKGPRRDTGGENALAPRHATLEAPLFRNPVIMTYTDDASQAQSEAQTCSVAEIATVVSGDTKSYTGVSTLASVDLKSDTGVSTIASSAFSQDNVEKVGAGTGTVVSADLSVEDDDEERKDVLTTMMMGSPEDSDTDDDEEDAFADARRLSDEFEHPIYGQKLRQSGTSLQSLLERDEQARQVKQHGRSSSQRLSRGPLGKSLSSVVSDDPSTLTFETEKENSVAPAPRVGSLGSKVLSFKNSGATVNPSAQQRHAPPAGDLCLSPTKRTPLQARKWRSLAAAAQEKDQAKKSAGSKKRGHLMERSSNIMIGNQ